MKRAPVLPSGSLARDRPTLKIPVVLSPDAHWCDNRSYVSTLGGVRTVVCELNTTQTVADVHVLLDSIYERAVGGEGTRQVAALAPQYHLLDFRKLKLQPHERLGTVCLGHARVYQQIVPVGEEMG
jgi:hypothetical protein